MSTAALSANGGYIYNLFHALGLSDDSSQHLESLLTKPLAIVLLIIATVVLSRVGGRIIRRTLGKMHDRVALHDAGRASRIETVSRIATNLWRVVVDVVGIIVVLSVIGLNLTPFVAGATVIGATIGFGAQSLVRDFLSGLLMLLEDQYRIGDLVVINEIRGTVDELSLRVTRLRDADGTEWYIPNGQILKVGNRARHWSRTVLSTQFNSACEIKEATQVLRETMHRAVLTPEIQGKLIAEPTVLGVSAVTSDAITIDIEIRTQPLVEAEVERILREMAVEALRANDMLPPRPC
jgi:small-conductance mechanosensitive channel